MKYIRAGIVLRGDEGIEGRMYGGKLLSILDSVGLVAALKTFKGELVTVATNCRFNAPIYVGEITEYYYETKVGKTSITVDLEVRVDNNVRADAQYVFVNIVEGKPTKIEL